jgi:uncharacterized protein (TIGR03089 family)
MAQPLRTPPPGWVDYVTEVRQYGDHFTPGGPVRPQDPADAKHSHADLVAAARARGIAPGARLLVYGDAFGDPVDWLLAPIAAGGSIVLCRNLDPAKVAGRIAAERVTGTLS